MATHRNGLPHFRVSPAVLGPLGAEQLQDPALAVLELIKNAWDADATRVKVTVEQKGHSGRIIVADNGHGMTRAEFVDRWLVIGGSLKRAAKGSEGGRPLIGEKGLGRLASFALGNGLTIASARSPESGFRASIDWQDLSASASLEDYPVEIRNARLDTPSRTGTAVTITDLRADWSARHTQFLVSHAEFLVSVPEQELQIALLVNGKRHAIDDATSTIDRLTEAQLEMSVGADGVPAVESCSVNGVDETSLVFRQMTSSERDRSLEGVTLSLKFFRRDGTSKRLSDILEKNEIAAALERFQGVRIFRDGINVPPYGLNGDDWAALERQRTATGGPTLVPGNSQLMGEIRLSRRSHPQFVITAGRSGFADQSAVESLANYVRWAVRALATARRAQHFGITDRSIPIPGRTDDSRYAALAQASDSPSTVLRQVAKAIAVRNDPELSAKVATATALVTANDEVFRLYAQLASSGIAAMSFAHELREDFDIVSAAIAEIEGSRRRPDAELLAMLNGAWARIRSFAGLFKVVPVKTRRKRKTLSTTELRLSMTTVLGLAPPDRIQTQLEIEPIRVNIVPVELDSIVLNLVSNAVKAISESSNRDHGRIRVALSNVKGDLEVRVADNGSGINPRVQRVMFDPLEGKFEEGTGMGLPIVKYIASHYDGAISVEKRPPEGFKTELVVQLRRTVR